MMLLVSLIEVSYMNPGYSVLHGTMDSTFFCLCAVRETGSSVCYQFTTQSFWSCGKTLVAPSYHSLLKWHDTVLSYIVIIRITITRQSTDLTHLLKVGEQRIRAGACSKTQRQTCTCMVSDARRWKYLLVWYPDLAVRQWGTDRGHGPGDNRGTGTGMIMGTCRNDMKWKRYKAWGDKNSMMGWEMQFNTLVMIMQAEVKHTLSWMYWIIS